MSYFKISEFQNFIYGIAGILKSWNSEKSYGNQE
jgi:hypothetical protein